MGFKRYLDSIPSYEPGKPIEMLVRDYGICCDNIIKLASNENPLGVSPKAALELQNEISNAFRYPDDSMLELKSAISKKYGLQNDNIIIGSGSDQIIEFIIKAVCDKNDKILTSAITFAMYEIYAKHNEAKVIKTKSAIHKKDEFIEECKVHNPALVFLCVPNNPLGDCLDSSDVCEIIESVGKDCIVVVDCAYMEFAKYKDKSKALEPKELIEKYSNVIYLGTFSKLYGLGGLRIGFGISRRDNITTLSKIRPPFNVTTLSLIAAKEALNDSEFIESTLQNNFTQMRIYEEFANANDIEFIQSYTNFITYIFDCKSVDSDNLCEFLLKNGIIIRNLKSYNINGVRITIGTKEQNEKVLQYILMYIKG